MPIGCAHAPTQPNFHAVASSVIAASMHRRPPRCAQWRTSTGEAPVAHLRGRRRAAAPRGISGRRARPDWPPAHTFEEDRTIMRFAFEPERGSPTRAASPRSGSAALMLGAFLLGAAAASAGRAGSMLRLPHHLARAQRERACEAARALERCAPCAPSSAPHVRAGTHRRTRRRGRTGFARRQKLARYDIIAPPGKVSTSTKAALGSALGPPNRIIAAPATRPPMPTPRPTLAARSSAWPPRIR